MKKLILFLLLFSVTAYARNVVLFDKVSARGSGCPDGTVSIIKTPDMQTVSILFDSFSAEVPQYDGDNDNADSGSSKHNEKIDHKVCKIIFRSSLPTGFSVEALKVKFDFRGHTYLEKGSMAKFRSLLIEKNGLGFSGRKIQRRISEKKWLAKRDEIDEDWMIDSDINIPIRSKCSKRANEKITFKLKNILAARIKSSGLSEDTTGIITMDSADITGKMEIKVRLKRCTSGNRARDRGRVVRRDY